MPNRQDFNAPVITRTRGHSPLRPRLGHPLLLFSFSSFPFSSPSPSPTDFNNLMMSSDGKKGAITTRHLFGGQCSRRIDDICSKHQQKLLMLRPLQVGHLYSAFSSSTNCRRSLTIESRRTTR